MNLKRYSFRISQKTRRRRLADDDLRQRMASPTPLLTVKHRRQKLNFAREHLDWDIVDWSRMLFIHDSRYCIFSDYMQSRVYRGPGERNTQ